MTRSLRVKLVASVIVALVGLAPAAAFAAWSGPRASITYLHTYDGGFKFYIQGVNHNCGNPDQQFEVPLSQGNARELYSMVLMVFSTQAKIRVFFTCNAGGRGEVTEIDVQP